MVGALRCEPISRRVVLSCDFGFKRSLVSSASFSTASAGSCPRDDGLCWWLVDARTLPAGETAARPQGMRWAALALRCSHAPQCGRTAPSRVAVWRTCQEQGEGRPAPPARLAMMGISRSSPSSHLAEGPQEIAESTRSDECGGR